MKDLRTKNNFSIAIGLVLLGCLLNSCKKNPSEPSSIDLPGQWVATEIEGAIDANGNPLKIDGNVSTWIFNSDGTYQWFLHARPFYYLDGTGTYSLNGKTLTVDGVIANSLFSRTAGTKDVISLTLGTDKFSFRDEDGDRWSYARK